MYFVRCLVQKNRSLVGTVGEQNSNDYQSEYSANSGGDLSAALEREMNRGTKEIEVLHPSLPSSLNNRRLRHINQKKDKNLNSVKQKRNPLILWCDLGNQIALRWFL